MNKLNWPTAFVIVAIIFAGAFVYNKPTGAAFGSDGMISASSNAGVFQLKGNKIRACAVGDNAEMVCSNWTKD